MGLVSTMMKSTATLLRPAIDRGTAGGVLQEFVPYATNVPCAVAQGGATQDVMYQQRNSKNSCTIYFADNPNTEINDNATITDMLQITRRYRIDGQAQPLGDRGVVWHVSASYVPEPGKSPV